MPNELKSHPGIVSLPSRLVAVVGLVLIVSLAISLPAFAQDNPVSVRRIRAIETGDLGVSHPAGLAYSPATNTFHVVEVRQPVRLPAPFSDIIDIRPVGDRVGQVRMWATTADPINMAYDPEANRLLLYGSASGQLLEMAAVADGHVDPATLARHDGRRFALQNPQGMAVDPASGNLFFLDRSGPRIVRIEPSPDGGFEDAVMTEADLAHLNSSDLHGLAMNPANGHLYVLGRAEQTLYELTQAGRVVASRDVSGYRLSDPQGMVFAPSGDLTDDPTSLSLYVADSGLSVGQEQRTESPAGGQISELTFAQPAAAAAAGFVASLVHMTDTSLFLPPSPDPVGIAYIDSSNTLMISDSEVNELPIFTGENLFRVRLSGDLFDTLTTVPFSYEPSGIDYNPNNGHLFISDDDWNEIFEMDPGADGLYDTGDDIITSFDTEVYGSFDPTDVTFARGMGDLFISDWVNSEVLRISPGANGVFDGVDDVLVTSFDTTSLGVLHPEGVAFNPDNGHLYLVGLPVTATVEATVGGDFVQSIDISAANPYAPSGLTFGPGSIDPNVTHIYITEWGLDNAADPNENDGKVYEMTLPPIPGSLSVVKEVEPASAGPSDLVTYTLSFSNDGDSIASEVTITDIIPVSVTVQSVVSSGVTITPRGSVSFTWGVEDLSPGEGGVITITAALSPTLPCGHTFTNTATITATTGDSGPSDNRSSATVAVGRGVVVTPPGASDSGNPGTDVVYSLSLENTGTCADTYDVSVNGNVWAVSAPATVGPLAAGADTGVDVTVTIPPDARCGADFATVTFTSQSGGTVSDSSFLTTTARTIYSVSVEPLSSVAFGNPGADVVHTLWVTNTGNCVDTFDLDASGYLWTLSAPSVVGPLGPGMGAGVNITATVPPDALGGDSDAATITLTSQGNGTVFDTSNLTTMVEEAYGVQVEPTSDAGSGDPGADVFYSLLVTNTGTVADTFDLAVGDADWPTEAPVIVGPLDPDMGARVHVAVTVPLDAGCSGVDSATITLTSQSDGSTADSSVLTTSANSVSALSVVPPGDSASGAQGADVVYTLWVFNSGNCTDTFDGDVSGNAWTTDVPTSVGPLAPGDHAEVPITVTVPADAQCGDDIATVTFTSQGDGSTSGSSVLTTSAIAFYGVTVNPPSDTAWGDPGADVIHTLWVTNIGNCPDTFDLAASGHAWNTDTPTTVGPLPGGAGAAVDVTVSVPQDAGCGDEDSATVTLTSQAEGTASDTSDLTTSASTVRGVAVDPSSDAASDDPGADVVYTLWVTNTGNCADTFDLALTGDEWTTVAPDTVGPLAAGLGASVGVTVTVPTCTEGGANDASAVAFTSQNDGAESDSAILTTTANYAAPVAVDDAYLALEDTTRTVGVPGVLGNDVDANCNPLSASLETAPANGTVVLEADGSFTYTPTVNFSGDDSFSYSASDGALIGTATVTLTVISAGDDPIVDAGGDQTVDEGETVQFAGSFIDPARQILFADGGIHWDYGDGNTATGSLTPTHEYWDNGLYTVTLTVTDTAGDAGEDSLLVTVRNVAPTVDAGPDLPAVPGKPLGMSGGFTDPGLDDTHSIIWDLDDGTIVLDTLTFDHTYEAVGVYTITLTVIDDDAGAGSDTAVIGVWYRPYLPLVSRDYAP